MAKKKKEAKKAAAAAAAATKKGGDGGKKQKGGAKKKGPRTVPLPADVPTSVYETLANATRRAAPGSTAQQLVLNAGEGDERTPHFSFHAARFRPPASGFYKAVLQPPADQGEPVSLLVDAKEGRVFPLTGGTGVSGKAGPALPENRAAVGGTTVRFVFHKAGRAPPTAPPPAEARWNWDQAADPVTARVEESKSAYDLYVSLPAGFARDDLRVTVGSGKLTVWGSRGGWDAKPAAAAAAAAAAPGLTFVRSVALPADVAEDAVSAGLRDGPVLHVRLGKKAQRDAVAFEVSAGEGDQQKRLRLDKRLVEVVRGATAESIAAMERHHAEAQKRRAEMIEAEQQRLREHDEHADEVRRRKENLGTGPWAEALRRVNSLLGLVDAMPTDGAAEQQPKKKKQQPAKKEGKAGKKSAPAPKPAAKAEAKAAAPKAEAKEEDTADSALLKQLKGHGYSGAGAAALGVSFDASGAAKGTFAASMAAHGYGRATGEAPAPTKPAEPESAEPRLVVDARVAVAFVALAAETAAAESEEASNKGADIPEGFPGSFWLRRAAETMPKWFKAPAGDDGGAAKGADGAAVDQSKLAIVGVQLAQSVRRWLVSAEAGPEHAVARAAMHLLSAMDRRAGGGGGGGGAAAESPLPWADEKLDAKLVKACVKEGGKKGQDLAGMSDMGGVKFFHCSVIKPDGSLALLAKVVEGMNKEVEDGAEDRKGGAGHIGKMLLSAGKDQVAVACHIPDDLAATLTADEWLGAVLKPIGGEVVARGGGVVYAVAKGSADKELFPLKMRDAAINSGFDLLKGKRLVVDDESEDSTNYAELAGVEW